MERIKTLDYELIHIQVSEHNVSFWDKQNQHSRMNSLSSCLALIMQLSMHNEQANGKTLTKWISLQSVAFLLSFRAFILSMIWQWPELLSIMADFDRVWWPRQHWGREERGGDTPTETDTNQIIVWHNREFWLVCTGLAWPSRLRSLIVTLASSQVLALIFWRRLCGDQFSRQRDLFSSEEINRDSVKNDEGPPCIQLAWNIFPSVIQKLLWPWLLVQLGRDVRHWKCLEFGRISVVNCCSRSLEEPKNSFNFFLSQYWFISFLSVINFLQSEARQTWVNFNCVEKCLIVPLLRTLWNSDQWLYCPYTFYVCHPNCKFILAPDDSQIHSGMWWIEWTDEQVYEWILCRPQE